MARTEMETRVGAGVTEETPGRGDCERWGRGRRGLVDELLEAGYGDDGDMRGKYENLKSTSLV